MKPSNPNRTRVERTENPPPENKGLRTFYRDAEKAILDRHAEQHRASVDPERLAWERNHPASLETRTEFERAYQTRYGKMPAENVVGFYDPVERSAHVCVEKNDDVSDTIGHEHTHGLVSPEANRKLPSSVIEGAVENDIRKVTEHEPEPGDLAAYEREVQAIRALEKEGWADAVERALFKGDTEALRRAVDETLRRREAPRTP